MRPVRGEWSAAISHYSPFTSLGLFRDVFFRFLR